MRMSKVWRSFVALLVLCSVLISAYLKGFLLEHRKDDNKKVHIHIQNLGELKDILKKAQEVRPNNESSHIKRINIKNLGTVDGDDDNKIRDFTNKTVQRFEKLHDYIPSIPVGSTSPKIPHIIHQTWDNEDVPVDFAKYIVSCRKMHPTWEYWFWTPVQVEAMLTKHFPEYIDMYKNYTEPIFKANLMRYFIMYKYGGVYADLDLECLRPLDNWTMDNECVMSENNYVHAFLIGERAESDLMITLLAARPGHPYFKKAIDMLPLYKAMKYDNKLLYADQVYRTYVNTAEGKMPGNSVTVAHPDYFLPTYDKGWSAKVRRMCHHSYSHKLNANQRMTCVGVNDGTNGLKPKPHSYTNHYWVHVILWGKMKEKKSKLSISYLVPDVVIPHM